MSENLESEQSNSAVGSGTYVIIVIYDLERVVTFETIYKHSLNSLNYNYIINARYNHTYISYTTNIK